MSANINPEDKERWLSDGNCAYCRRRGYCKKMCAAQKQRRDAILRNFIGKVTGEDLRKVLK